MSYCRIGPHSEVYCYHNGKVFNTILAGGFIAFRDRTTRRALDRMEALKSAGVKVPATAITRLCKELKR